MNISQSIHEIFSREEVLADLFYDIFLDRHPEVQKYFVGVDLKQQAVVLTMMLSVIAEYSQHAYPAATRYLLVLGRKHQQLGIPVDLMPNFGRCLLETLERFHGRDWNAELRTAWQRAIALASQVLASGYEPEPVSSSPDTPGV